jgi:hypothetical protein
VVCAGPKAYSVMLENILTGEISFEPKVKGLSKINYFVTYNLYIN